MPWYERLAVPNLFIQRVCFMLNTCFHLEGLEFWYVLGISCLCERPLVKTLGTGSLMSFSGRWHFTCVVTTLPWKWSTSCVTPLGEDSWKLKSGFLWTFPHMPFPFVDFSLYPLIVIIPHSCEYTLCWAPWVLVNLPNWGWGCSLQVAHPNIPLFLQLGY